MEPLAACRAAAKHWYISGAIMLLAVLLALISFFSATTAWNATSSVVVAPPSRLSSVTGRPSEVPGNPPANPLATAGGARLIATLLTDNMNSQEVHDQLTAQGVASGYSARVADSNFPVVSLQVTGSSAQQVTTDTSRIVGAADPVLVRLQQRTAVPDAAVYHAGQAVPNSVPVASTPDRSRALIAILVGGVVVAVIAAAVWETVLRRRSPQTPSTLSTPSTVGARAPGAGPVEPGAPVASTVEFSTNSSVPQSSASGAERDA